MPSIRSRIFYWLYKVQGPPFDPDKSAQQQWQAFAGFVPEARQVIDRVGVFIRKHLA